VAAPCIGVQGKDWCNLTLTFDLGGHDACGRLVRVVVLISNAYNASFPTAGAYNNKEYLLPLGHTYKLLN